MCGGQRTTFGVSVLSHVGPMDRTQVVRLGCKCLDPLNHYICPATFFNKANQRSKHM